MSFDIDPHSPIVPVVIALVERSKTNSTCVVSHATRLIEDAGIDSLGLIDLIEEVQSACQISFEPDDYSVENFETVESIVALVQERLRSG